MNEIFIHGLEVDCHIGVPAAERAAPQRLLIDIHITPLHNFADLHDDITRTVDYDDAARRIIALAQARPRHLIESLAAEIADMLVTEFPAASATVEIRKFILKNAAHVGVRCSRQRPS